ncbi:uncharacterized protein RCC_02662 [Ramularia collo-cygni]|uniref:6-phosphogluconate dehydrogenase C-terminal domain-like protein n=1 Tax=Ramularia collo-cygni TaxID=112498 RepID=A0A2D3UQX9_9PEZI|nr:uncharacterized protein RCC_02662 [Ramularia collo-cygni]CZT16828.1 uncharacterized protein RCC_02662 [Ramularia collo-cygni]
MGAGIARLLLANDFHVIANVSDRSQATQERAAKCKIELVGSDAELCKTSDYILSIVPPRDAIATAQRVVGAMSGRVRPLYYIDLNAISPRSAREIHDIFLKTSPNVRYIDGGIIGNPPMQQADGTFKRPSIPLSGPHSLVDAVPSGDKLRQVLNVRHINEVIGTATGLKMCFASLTKGFTALAIQSYTTAQNLGVLDELKTELDLFSPDTRTRAEKGLVSMPPKAYRWINEMEQIAETHEADGGFLAVESTFRSIARVYDLVKESELGNEFTEHRVRGQTAQDVAALMVEATDRRKLKKD